MGSVKSKFSVATVAQAIGSVFLLWPPVIAAKVVLVLLGPIVVPIGMAFGRVPVLYQADSNRPQTAWEMIVRNPVNGMKWWITPPEYYYTVGEIVEPHATTKRVQARWNVSRLLTSFRFLVKWNDKRYSELYIGWKLGSEPGALDFALSFRPFATVGN